MIADDVLLLLAYWNYFDMLFGCAFAFGALLIIVHTYNVHKYIELAPASRKREQQSTPPPSLLTLIHPMQIASQHLRWRLDLVHSLRKFRILTCWIAWILQYSRLCIVACIVIWHEYDLISFVYYIRFALINDRISRFVVVYRYVVFSRITIFDHHISYQ